MKLLLAVFALAMVLVPAQGRADERILQFMEDRWTHALLHHVGDESDSGPLALGLADCVDKRALDRRRRNAARRLGTIFERS